MSAGRKHAKPMADAKPTSEGQTVTVGTLSAGQAADIKVYGQAIDPETGLVIADQSK